MTYANVCERVVPLPNLPGFKIQNKYVYKYIKHKFQNISVCLIEMLGIT